MRRTRQRVPTCGLTSHDRVSGTHGPVRVQRVVMPVTDAESWRVAGTVWLLSAWSRALRELPGGISQRPYTARDA